MATLRDRMGHRLHGSYTSAARLLGKEPDKVRQVIVQNLQHWLEDPDLTRVHGPQVLSMLPESERRPWQKLWDEVADALARAQRKTTPEKSSGAR
jgi:hypothetical protein